MCMVMKVILMKNDMQFVVCFRYLRDIVLILSQPLMELVQKSLWTI